MEPDSSDNGIRLTSVLGKQGKPLGKEAHDRIQNKILAYPDETDAAIQKRLKEEDQIIVSRETVRQNRLALQLPGKAPGAAGWGPKVHDQIQRQILAHPDETDAAIQKRLKEENQIKVSLTTVWKDRRALHRRRVARPV